MNIRQQLVDGDPVAREPELDAADAAAIRQRVLVEARAAGVSASPRLWWFSPIAVGAALAMCLLVAIGLGLRISTPSDVERPFQGRGQNQDPGQPPRQLQFATPGGTRIIWTFHQEFDL
jgi:hypothetical protein